MDNNTRYLILGLIVIVIIALIGLSYTLNNTPVPDDNGTFNNTTNATPPTGTVPGGNITVTPTEKVITTPTGTPGQGK